MSAKLGETNNVIGLTDMRADKDVPFETFQAEMGDPTARQTFINWCLQEGIEFDLVFHNRGRLLQHEGEEPTMEHFKGIMNELVEKPMFINSDLLEAGLLAENALIVHSVVNQPGISEIITGSMQTMKRCLDLGQRKVMQVDPGLYEESMITSATNDEAVRKRMISELRDPSDVADDVLEQINNARMG